MEKAVFSADETDDENMRNRDGGYRYECGRCAEQSQVLLETARDNQLIVSDRQRRTGSLPERESSRGGTGRLTSPATSICAVRPDDAATG